jgi:hypothetical protein
LNQNTNFQKSDLTNLFTDVANFHVKNKGGEDMRQLTFEETKFVSGSAGSSLESGEQIVPEVRPVTVVPQPQGFGSSPAAGAWHDFVSNANNLNVMTIAGGILFGDIGANVGWIADQVAKALAEQAAPIDKEIMDRNVQQLEIDASHRTHGLEITSWTYPSVAGGLGSQYVP